jgi:hypothetical protein
VGGAAPSDQLRSGRSNGSLIRNNSGGKEVRHLTAYEVCVRENRWHNGRTGGSEILVLNVVHGTEAFMRTWDARISILARVRPETDGVDGPTLH